MCKNTYFKLIAAQYRTRFGYTRVKVYCLSICVHPVTRDADRKINYNKFNSNERARRECIMSPRSYDMRPRSFREMIGDVTPQCRWAIIIHLLLVYYATRKTTRRYVYSSLYIKYKPHDEPRELLHRAIRLAYVRPCARNVIPCSLNFIHSLQGII